MDKKTKTPMAEKGATFTIKRATDGQFYFVISGRNNEPICASETYRTKQSAKKSINAIVDLILAAKHEVVDETTRKARKIT